MGLYYYGVRVLGTIMQVLYDNGTFGLCVQIYSKRVTRKFISYNHRGENLSNRLMNTEWNCIKNVMKLWNYKVHYRIIVTIRKRINIHFSRATALHLTSV